ncbi:MAG: SMP-30/gluconolactonase/LRE family protein [Leptospirales bacterium]|jgi:sugar lactone lactonase YvrE
MSSRTAITPIRIVLALLIAFGLYLCFWPVPVSPVAWQAPADAGYTGDFAINTRLADLEATPLIAAGRPEDVAGPEDIAIDANGRIYTGTQGGQILRLPPPVGGKLKAEPEVWAETGGHPLGLDFDRAGNLIVADAFRGLLQIDPEGRVSVLSNSADGRPILFADDLDVAQDGRIYFSDASTKFGAEQFGGVGPASLLDILEHGGHGRLLVYDPASKSTKVLVTGLNFANGVALAADDSFVLINETGSYRVLRYWLRGPRATPDQQPEEWLGNLPGFPDNIERDRSANLFWIAMASPRSAALDDLSDSPFLRKLVQRLPGFLRPKAVPHLHIVAADPDGRIVHNLQDPGTEFHTNTSVYATATMLYLGSLHETGLIAVERGKIGL